jgi:hypothetical protein
VPEVLILSKEPINRHKPKCNIQFEDDKCEPHIKVTWREVFSQVLIVCRMEPARELLCESRAEFEEMSSGGDAAIVRDRLEAPGPAEE